MAEVKKPVQTFYIEYLCDACGIGNMMPTGVSNPVYPPLYVHKCTHCNNVVSFTKTYPTVKYLTATGEHFGG
jgi:hypothetical protein